MAPRTSTLARRVHRLDANNRAVFTQRMQRFFADQAARVVHRFLLAIPAVQWDRRTKDAFDELPVTPPTAEEVLPDEEKQLLWLALMPLLLLAMNESANLAGDMVGLVPITLEMDPRIVELMRDAATRVAGIHRATLNAIRATLSEGVSRGYSARQIAYGVPQEGFRGLRDAVTEVYKGRAETIARNEIANARALASIERFQEARVRMVYITDGPGCGWTSHNSGDTASGTTRTLLEYQQTPFSHVNCQRVGIPIRAAG